MNKRCDDRIDHVESLLAQTQCQQCDYSGCRPYAEAIVSGEADIDRCIPEFFLNQIENTYPLAMEIFNILNTLRIEPYIRDKIIEAWFSATISNSVRDFTISGIKDYKMIQTAINSPYATNHAILITILSKNPNAK